MKWILVILVVIISRTVDCQSTPVFKEHIKINEFGILDLDAVGMKLCVNECRKRALCKTMAFNSISMSCKLHNVTIDSAEKARLTQPSPPTTLSEINRWEIKPDPCRVKACGANTKCIVMGVKGAAVARCILTECSNTPFVSNASPLPCSRAVQTTLSFECTEDHVVVDGPAVVTCLTNGSWSLPTFKCLVDCGAPPSVTDATFTKGVTTTMGSHVTYTCAEGMHAERGRASTECLESGSWSRPTFVCLNDRHKLLSVGPAGQMIQFDLPPGREEAQPIDHRSHCVREAIYDVISGRIYVSAVGRPHVVGYREVDNPNVKPIMFGELALGLAVDCLANRLFSCYLSRRYIVATDENGKHGKEIYQAHGKVSKLALDRDKRYVYFTCTNSIGRVGYDGQNFIRITRTAKPAGLYLHDNVIYICSSTSDDIRTFNLTSSRLQTVAWAEGDTPHRCWDILVEKDHIYVSHIKKVTISKFGLKGEKEEGLHYGGIYRGIRALIYLP